MISEGGKHKEVSWHSVNHFIPSGNALILIKGLAFWAEGWGLERVKAAEWLELERQDKKLEIEVAKAAGTKEARGWTEKG